jgi:hypothetical protein
MRRNEMDAKPVNRSLYQRMSLPMLKGFVFIIFPVAIFGQVMVVIDKVNKGILEAGTFGLPNIVTLVCCIVAAGVFAFGVYTGWLELRSRT